MNIGEMFLSIGVKGTDKSVKDLKAVHGAIGDIRDTSFGAKTAIMGMVYGLEQLMSGAMNTGTGITQFANSTGMGVKYIQDLKYAMLDFVVSGDEVESTLKGLQTRISGMRTNQGTAPLFGTFMQAVGFDQNKLTDMPYLMQKISEYSKMPDTFDKRMFMQGIGIGDNFTSAFVENAKRGKKAFNFENLPSSPVGYSEKQASSLMSQQAHWSKIYAKFQHGLGQVLAKHGDSGMVQLEHIADKILKVTEAFVGLAEKLHVFQGIAHTLEFIEAILKRMTPMDTTEKGRGKDWETSEDKKKRQERQTALQKMLEIFYSGNAPIERIEEPEFIKKLNSPMIALPPQKKPGKKESFGSNTIAPTVNIYTDVKDPKKHGKMAGDELKIAAANLNALLQVS